MNQNAVMENGVINFENAREDYIAFVTKDIPETYARYLMTAQEESNKRRFLIVAYAISKKKTKRAEGVKIFYNIIKGIRADIADEVRHDGPEVMNMVGVCSAIRTNKGLILFLVKTLENRMRKSKEFLKSNGFVQFEEFTPLEIFDMFIPYNGYDNKDLRRRQHELIEKLGKIYSGEKMIEARL